jgi:hypothetical protein
VGDEAELGRQHDLVASAPDGAADELLVGVGPVDLGGVDVGDSQIECPVNGANRLGLAAVRVEVIGGHPHRAESDAGDVEFAE